MRPASPLEPSNYLKMGNLLSVWRYDRLRTNSVEKIANTFLPYIYCESGCVGWIVTIRIEMWLIELLRFVSWQVNLAWSQIDIKIQNGLGCEWYIYWVREQDGTISTVLVEFRNFNNRDHMFDRTNCCSCRYNWLSNYMVSSFYPTSFADVI